jgi:hypothetical protein
VRLSSQNTPLIILGQILSKEMSKNFSFLEELTKRILVIGGAMVTRAISLSFAAEFVNILLRRIIYGEFG